MLHILPFTLQQNIATDNAFSTIQLIHQIKAKMDEVIEVVNNMETDSHEYTDAKILELKALLEGQIGQLETIVSENNQRVNETVQLVNQLSDLCVEIQVRLTSEVSRLDSKIDTKYLDLLERLNTLNSLLRNYVDAQLQELKAYVEELIKERTAYAYSVWDGQKKPIEKVLEDFGRMIFGTVSMDFTVEHLDKFLSTQLNMDGTGNQLFSSFTVAELDNALDAIGAGYSVTLQKTSGGATQSMPLIKNTFDSLRLNPFACLYGIFYRMCRQRDVGNRVVPYSYYTAVLLYTGWDSWNYSPSMSYLYN